MAQRNDLRFTHIELANWRNFGRCEIALAARVFLVGPNAAGKSNLLDVFRFLRELVVPGGGLQEAVRRRGGVSAIRALHARRDPEISIRVEIGGRNNPREWRYELAFNAKRDAAPQIVREQVHHGDKLILTRPDKNDRDDSRRLTQTHLEQISANTGFRALADFLSSIAYLHVVPQLIRDPERRGADLADPLGGDLIQRIAETPPRTRDARLKRITTALQVAVPQIGEIGLSQDTRGRWHLRAKYRHWRPQGAWQTEERFSDGTLRLLGLLWALGEPGGPLLLEEPELSLHSAVVVRLPALFARMHRSSGRQVIVTTHSEHLLQDEGIGLDEVFILRPAPEGTTVAPARDTAGVAALLERGVPLGEAVLPMAAPRNAEQLVLLPL